MALDVRASLPLVPPDTLEFCIENGLNVLLQGAAGVGKTSIVLEAFAKANLRVLTLSGATMDPWVDFVGVPRPLSRSDGSHVLELVRRSELADDAVDAIFIDEFNRAPAKARNAALEILQFQSVNGHRFRRLRMVWAAINPADDRYDTERLDPAQADRFHVHLQVPYRPCPSYFIKKHGSMGKSALEWWDSQAETAKAKVSPRRLDYALDVVKRGGPVRHVLPPEANVKTFLRMLKEGSLFDRLKGMMQRGDTAAAAQLLGDPLEGSQAVQQVLRSKAASLFFLPLLPPERLASLLDTPTVRELMIQHATQVPEFHNAILAALAAPESSVLKRKILASLKAHKVELGHSPALLSQEEPLSPDDIAQYDPFERLT